jgi:hypothetical protein
MPPRTTRVAPMLALGAGLLVSLACSPRPRETTVVGTDYAFQLEEVLPSGPTAFGFENQGKVPHEMVLVRLREGVTLQHVMEGMQRGAQPDEFLDGTPSILIAAPGQSSSARILMDLAPGREYALVCNFRDGEAAAPHVELGMVKGFRAE